MAEAAKQMSETTSPTLDQIEKAGAAPAGKLKNLQERAAAQDQ
jgi:hypothetical protein